MGPVGASGLRGASTTARPSSAALTPGLTTLGLTALGWLLGAAVTAAILGTPYLVYGYHSAALHLVLDSVDACVALLAAYLLHRRSVRTRSLRDALLAQALVLLATAGLGLALFGDLAGSVRETSVATWLALVARVVGALLVLAAALSGSRTVDRRHERRVVAVPWLLVVVAATALVLAGDRLPLPLGQDPPPSAEHPVVAGHPLLVAAQAVTAGCFLLGSLLFAARSAGSDDELLRWLGPALALGGFARLNYVLFPSLYSDWLYTGDLLRTGCYLLLLLGAVRELRQYWPAQARVAVLAERRRVARELHDGVVQELGYIRAEAHSLEGPGGGIVAACDRALDEARAAIAALDTRPDEPLSVVLERAARQVAERYDGRVDVVLDAGVDADPEQRHALARITREALANAFRHGRATRVLVRLERGPDARRLVVRDDGCGFDVPAVTPGGAGYGMVSMRDRAAALPGALSVVSRPGAGTQVEVVW